MSRRIKISLPAKCMKEAVKLALEEMLPGARLPETAVIVIEDTCDSCSCTTNHNIDTPIEISVEIPDYE